MACAMLTRGQIKLSVIHLFGVQVVVRKALPGYLFPLCSGSAVITVGVDGDTASGEEFAPDLNIGGLHQLYQVVHYYINAVLMEIPVVAEAEKIELQRFALHHFYTGDIGDIDRGKVRLSGDGAQTGELGTVELYKVVTILVLVFKGLKHRRVVACGVIRIALAQKGDVLILFFSAHFKPPVRSG